MNIVIVGFEQGKHCVHLMRVYTPLNNLRKKE